MKFSKISPQMDIYFIEKRNIMYYAGIIVNGFLKI